MDYLQILRQTSNDIHAFLRLIVVTALFWRKYLIIVNFRELPASPGSPAGSSLQPASVMLFFRLLLGYCIKYFLNYQC